MPATLSGSDPHAARRAFEAGYLAADATPTWPPRRAVREPDCPLRTPLQRDRDRIVHSKAFRRLKDKTQVFLAPEGDHYRTRLTHTLEVTGVARTVARALGLNEDLAEAIGLSHDLGHAPFGHLGEEALDAAVRARGGGGFRHHEHSVRVVSRLEDPPSAVREAGGRGLNLCRAVLDGIAGHSGRAPLPACPEGRIVRVVDRIAYLNHDVDDAIRAGVIAEADLPASTLAALGRTASRRIDAPVADLVASSRRAGEVGQGPACAAAMDELRAWMFERVYLAPGARAERRKVAGVVERLLDDALERDARDPAAALTGDDDAAAPRTDDGGPAAVRPETAHPAAPAPRATAGAEGDGDPPLRRATDWVAGMTDRYALRAFVALTVPRGHA